MSSSVTEALRVNYSPLGSALIERLYSENYLSLSGEAATDELARQAGIGPDSHALDIGSGLGGPAMRLAQSHGCRVTGIDLVESNVVTARERVHAAGLDGLVDIRQGDATDLAFADDAFNVVWSQDALCHVPDKTGAIVEATRVTKPQGAIAFTDWVETAPMEADYEAEVLDALSAPNLSSLDAYCDLLARNGFEIAVGKDISDQFAARYEEIMARLEALEDDIRGRYSDRVFDIMMEKNGTLQRAFADGKLGGCQVVAHCPG
jgi:ubiquinone/menaquinone biosynthesis C-methylase UbiE